MAWPKGTPRPEGAGRKKGTPNKSTQNLLEKCEAQGIDVFQAMLELAHEAKGFEKFKMLAEIAQYILPKRKAVEIDSNVNIELAKKAEEYEAMPKERLIEELENEIKKLKGAI